MKVAAIKQVSYDPSIFANVETVDEALRIIVTPEAGLTSKHRWDVETRYLVTLIEKRCQLEHAVILDYGCGIGRLSKPLLHKTTEDVIGVDISPNMRALAESCVASPDRFMTMPPSSIFFLQENLCDLVIAVWTLQHVLDVREAVRQINHVLCDGGKLFVVNNVGRVVPSTAGWLDDGIDIRAILKDQFTELEDGQLEGDDVAPGTFKENTFWALYQK